MIQIPIAALKKARTLLGRVRFAQCKLPVLNHILARIDGPNLILAVSDLDRWLETRIPLGQPQPYAGPAEFLIPGEALHAAVTADKGSMVILQPKGRKKHRELKLVTISGGMRIESMHATADWEDFPARPSIEGPTTTLPVATMAALQAVVLCASRDEQRNVLQGVYFTPEEGGMLIATDGKHLAGAPAVVPKRKLILPTATVRVLGHSDFLAGEVTLTVQKDKEKHSVSFQIGDHLLITRTVEGSYPNYRQVVPREQAHTVTIPEDQREGICKWLRSQKARAESVCLSIDKPGHLTLTQADGRGNTIALITVKVEVQGTSPVISFNPSYLADAIQIGGILGLSDEMNPGMTSSPEGRFCVVMPIRTTASVRSAA